MKRIVFLLCLSLVASPLLSGTHQGFSKERLARASKVLDQLVSDNRIAGGVLLVLQDGKPVHEHVFGYQDKGSGKKMQRDTIFRIASQTKAVTSVAALILFEEGKLALHDPVSRYIPGFAKMVVRSADGKEVPAKREITILDLLTHTSGIDYGMTPQTATLYREKKLSLATEKGEFYIPLVGEDETVCHAMERLTSLPLVSQPGEAFVYGLNTDVLSCIIERVSGMSLDKFVYARITKPLKMKDTEFFLDKAKVSRLAKVYNYDADGKLVKAAEGPTGQGAFVDGPRKAFSGGGGLLSTAKDYARFLEMVRRGGELDGVRILNSRTISLMHTNQIGNLMGPGHGFGLGFQVTEQFGADGLLSVGSYGWAGAYGSVYRVDPKERMSVVYMVQQLPYLKTVEMRDLALNQVYQALN